jgi:hypothetical protein
MRNTASKWTRSSTKTSKFCNGEQSRGNQKINRTFLSIFLMNESFNKIFEMIFRHICIVLFDKLLNYYSSANLVFKLKWDLILWKFHNQTFLRKRCQRPCLSQFLFLKWLLQFGFTQYYLKALYTLAILTDNFTIKMYCDNLNIFTIDFYWSR